MTASQLNDEELAVAQRCANLAGRKRELLKCDYGYVLVDESGSYQFDTLDGVRGFITVAEEIFDDPRFHTRPRRPYA
jgi:hypothetical protein